MNLSPHQVAVALGKPFSQQVVLDLVASGELSGPIVRRARYIDKAAVVAYLGRLQAAVEAL